MMGKITESLQSTMTVRECVDRNRSLAYANLLVHGVFIWLCCSASYVNKHVNASKALHISLSQTRIFECTAEVFRFVTAENTELETMPLKVPTEREGIQPDIFNLAAIDWVKTARLAKPAME
jgi:hypothetical protein